MYVVGMNGPPRAGKDTIARLLVEEVERRHDLPIRVISLSEPMGRMAAAMLGVEWSESWYEEQKDTVQPILGVTLRQWIIGLSEAHMKPGYGEQIWPRLAIQRLHLEGFNCDLHGLIVITNFGFQYEPALFEATYGVQNVVVAQAHRAGQDYSKDSRGWVEATLPTHTIRLNNTGPIEVAKTEARRLYGRLVNQIGWQL